MGRKSCREQLIESGVETLRVGGFANTGIREITAAAGVPLGSFGNHFRSKEEFGLAVLDRYYERLEAVIGVTLRDKSRSPLARLEAYFEAMSGHLAGRGWRHGCLIGNMSLEASEHSEAIRERLARIFKDWTLAFVDALRAAQLAGEIRDDLAADELADVLMAAWNGAMLRMKVDRGPESIERFRRIVLGALLAHPSRPATP